MTELQREIERCHEDVLLRGGVVQRSRGVGRLDELADQLAVEDPHLGEQRHGLRHVGH